MSTTEPRKLSYCEALEHMRKGGKVKNSRYTRGLYLAYDQEGNHFKLHATEDRVYRHEVFNADDIYGAEWTVYEELKPQETPYHFIIELRGFTSFIASNEYLLTVLSKITDFLGDQMRAAGFTSTEINITEGNTDATSPTPAAE